MSESSNGVNGRSSSVSRRTLIKAGAVAGGAAAFLGGIPGYQLLRDVADNPVAAGYEYPLRDPENHISTVCLQCNTGCGIKVKFQDGVATKIDGNPYHPMTMYPHIPYDTPIEDIGPVEGAICPKGQAGLQTVYDPYRLLTVLKRKPGTRRGENQWVSISWDEAVDEITEGGDLFGEGAVPGLRESYALTDPEVASAMRDAIGRIHAEHDAGAKAELVEDFQQEFREHLDTLIDPEHPDLGPRNNQFVFAWGRLKDGRSTMVKRFMRGYGSTNAHGHTTVCQGSLYFTGKAMSEQYRDGKWTGGSKFYWQGDVGNSEFVIFVGASPFEGNYGPPLRTPRITQGTVDGRMKFAVVDPRFSKTASKAWKWVPAKPGAEGALALAMIQWILENNRFNNRYLRVANQAAAESENELTWTQAPWLVKLDDDGVPGDFLRASEIGLREPEEREKTSNPDETYEFDYFVAMVDGEPVAVDPYAQTPDDAVFGDLFVDDVDAGEFRVKSGLQLIADAANEYTLDEWAEICGISVSDIEELAFEFTNHGRQAVADLHRGASQHTNGFYNVLAWYTLNALIGNFDHAGGLIKGSTFKTDGTADGQPYQILQQDGSFAPLGTSIIRHNETYEDHTLFQRDGYPALRPWYPLSSDVYQEIVPSIGDAYPYPVKALMFYMGSPIYALPAGHTNIEILADPEKLPLFIAVDAFIGETSMYADYIFPDTTYLERWEFHGTHMSVPVKIQPVRNPAVDPVVPDVTVFGQETTMSVDSLLMSIAERLELPGFGPGGLGELGDLSHPDDLYIRMVANIASEDDGDEGAVPDADEEEQRIFREARRHLRESVFDIDRWRSIAGDSWPKVVYVLNRGGRFEAYSKGYTEGIFPEEGPNTFGLDLVRAGHPFGTMLNIYQEKTRNVRDSMTGQNLHGYARYVPSGMSILGEEIDDAEDGYDLRMITYREIQHTKSRTASNYWLLALLPENFILINEVDATQRGFADGDHARITSATNPDGIWNLLHGNTLEMVGKIRTTQGIRPGVIGFSLGFGHWSYGGVDFTVDDTVIEGDERRIKGFHANAAMRVDPHLGNTTLADPVGGSAAFYDTNVKLVRV